MYNIAVNGALFAIIRRKKQTYTLPSVEKTYEYFDVRHRINADILTRFIGRRKSVEKSTSKFEVNSTLKNRLCQLCVQRTLRLDAMSLCVFEVRYHKMHVKYNYEIAAKHARFSFTRSEERNLPGVTSRLISKLNRV